MVQKVTYDDKEAIQNDDSIENKNKVTADDMNEIKKAINQNADELTNYQQVLAFLKEKNIEEIEKENVRLKRDLQASQLIGEENGERIYINDSSNARFNQFKVQGNYSQETREGYNLLNNILESTTINGLTVTVNADKSVKVNGTTTASTNLTFDRHDGKLAAGTYTLKDCRTFIESTENQGWWIEGQTRTFTSEATLSNSGFFKTYSANTTVNETLYPMLIEGTEEKNYEQYGKLPTVDNPSTIKTVKDNVNIKIVSKNVLPIQNFTKTSGNFTCKYENGVFTLNGVGKQEFAISEFVDFQSLSKAALNKMVTFSLQDYTASVPIESNMGSVSAYHFMQLKSASNTSYSKLVSENLNSLRFWLGSSDTTFNNVTFKLQIEIENTKTSFEEHQEQSFVMPAQQEMLTGDYFDFENEKEVHNWNKIQSYNNETISKNYISTTGELSTGATVYYKLETPSELTLTDEQKTIAKQIKNILHTYKNVTHIYSTDEISPNFNVEYAKDLNTAINNIQVQVINNASEEVNV